MNQLMAAENRSILLSLVCRDIPLYLHCLRSVRQLACLSGHYWFLGYLIYLKVKLQPNKNRIYIIFFNDKEFLLVCPQS